MKTADDVDAFWNNIIPFLKGAGRYCTDHSKVEKLSNQLDDIAIHHPACEYISALALSLMRVHAGMEDYEESLGWD